jgi:hypothetical protein
VLCGDERVNVKIVMSRLLLRRQPRCLARGAKTLYLGATVHGAELGFHFRNLSKKSALVRIFLEKG